MPVRGMSPRLCLGAVLSSLLVLLFLLTKIFVTGFHRTGEPSVFLSVLAAGIFHPGCSADYFSDSLVDCCFDYCTDRLFGCFAGFCSDCSTGCLAGSCACCLSGRLWGYCCFLSGCLWGPGLSFIVRM